MFSRQISTDNNYFFSLLVIIKEIRFHRVIILQIIQVNFVIVLLSFLRDLTYTAGREPEHIHYQSVSIRMKSYKFSLRVLLVTFRAQSWW